MIGQFKHQSPSILETAIKEYLANAQAHDLSRAFQEWPISDANFRLCKALCHALLDYSGYHIAPVESSRVDPFDDPFVGAALITDDGELIASHRKETHHEPHAEAITEVVEEFRYEVWSSAWLGVQWGSMGDEHCNRDAPRPLAPRESMR